VGPEAPHPSASRDIHQKLPSPSLSALLALQTVLAKASSRRCRRQQCPGSYGTPTPFNPSPRPPPVAMPSLLRRAGSGERREPWAPKSEIIPYTGHMLANVRGLGLGQDRTKQTNNPYVDRSPPGSRSGLAIAPGCF
jgi:hypothetical protein